jgi:hypothetical protein
MLNVIRNRRKTTRRSGEKASLEVLRPVDGDTESVESLVHGPAIGPLLRWFEL